MVPEPTLAVVLVLAAVCLLASTIVGFSGFGFALIAVPLLTLMLDLKFVVPMELLLATFSVIVLSINNLHFVRNAKIIVSIGLIFAGTIVGIIIGANLLANFDTGILKRVLGVVVVLFAAHIFFRKRVENTGSPGSRNRLLRIIVPLVVGFLSGIAGGMFGTSGPPLVIYVDHFAEDKSAFRAVILAIFVLHNLFRMSLYIHHSLLTLEIAKFALCLLPVVCLGLYVGSKMHFKVNEQTFSRAVAVLLLISGLLLLRP
jgi:uncharacterized membrane protein YfcA